MKQRGCRRCAEDHGPYLRPDSCVSCREEFFCHLKKVKALYVYQAPFKAVVLALKQGRLSDVSFLTEILSERISGESVDLLVPVPRPFFRYLHTGHHPVLELTRKLSFSSGFPWENLLSTGLWGKRQRNKNVLERKKLSLNDFRVRRKISESKIMLVDDVMTTGATLNACAGALKRAGAKEVSALVLGRRMKGTLSNRRSNC
jgi:ComF family protein